MKATLEYSSYNRDLEKAIIPMNEENEMHLSVSEEKSEDDTNVVISKFLNISTINTLTDDKNSIKLTADEIKQYVVLLNQFAKQLA